MKSIPIYALYGERGQDQEQDWLHWETILSRSRLHDLRIEPHRHEQLFQVLYLKGGTAAVTIDGQSVDVAGPAVISIPAFTVHGYVFSDDVDGVVLTLFERDVSVALAGAPEIADAFRRPRMVTGRVEDFGMEELEDAVSRLTAEADRRAPGRAAAMLSRIALLLVAMHRVHLTSAQMAEARADRAVHHAQAFRALVDANYRQTRVMRFYAASLGITPSHLNRVCRQILGISALTVIERRIILEAKRSLMFSTMSIKEIAIVLGYPDPAYFSRFFARAAGIAPLQFRRTVHARRDGAD